MRFRISGLVLAAAMLLATGPARAAIIAAGGFTGQFHAGSIDTLGSFGTAGADLSGAVFNYQLSYDDTLTPNLHPTNDQMYTYDVGLNQTVTLLSNSASYTLNSSPGFGNSYIQNGALDPSTQYLQTNVFGPGGTYFAMQVAAAGSYVPDTIQSQAGLDSLLGTALAVNSNNFLVFVEGGSNYDLFAFDFIAVADAPTQGEPTGDVPEPLSLAIMGGGLAGLGFLRRRKAA